MQAVKQYPLPDDPGGAGIRQCKGGKGAGTGSGLLSCSRIRRTNKAGRHGEGKVLVGPEVSGSPHPFRVHDGNSTSGNPKGGANCGGNAGPVSKLRRNKWINRQVTRVADTGNLLRLLQTIHMHIPEMNGINLATALHRVTKLAVSGQSISVDQLLQHPSFRLLRATVVHNIEWHAPASRRQPCPDYPLANSEGSTSPPPASSGQPVFEVQCMSIVCWSCATLRLRENQLLGTIADIVMPHLGEMKPFELSNMLWAFAKLNRGPPSLYNAIADRVLRRRYGEFSMQCLSMITWSFATERQKHSTVFSSISREIVGYAAANKPQEIANTLWAYAKNRCGEVCLFNALGDTAIRDSMIWSFKPQELSNTVWAFATISLQHLPLFKGVVNVAITKRHELSPQNIANILWAYAKLGACRGSGLFPALLSVSLGMMEQHKPQEISAIVWAAAKENYPACRRFFGATAQLCSRRLHEFPPQALANMVEAFAVIDVGSSSFSEAMARESVGRLHQFEPMALSNLFRGVVLSSRCRRQGRDSERLLDVLNAISIHISWRVNEMPQSDISHIEQSLAILAQNARYTESEGIKQATEHVALRNIQLQSQHVFPITSEDWKPSLDGVGSSGKKAGNKIIWGKGTGGTRPEREEDDLPLDFFNVFEEFVDEDGSERHPHTGEEAYNYSEAWAIPSYPPGAESPFEGAAASICPRPPPGIWPGWEGVPAAPDAAAAGFFPAATGCTDSGIDETPWVVTPQSGSFWFGGGSGSTTGLGPMPLRVWQTDTQERDSARSVEQRWVLQRADVACLLQVQQNEASEEAYSTPIDVESHRFAEIIGAWGGVLKLRCGVLDEQVVVKRMVPPEGGGETPTYPLGLKTAAALLRPLACIAGVQFSNSGCYVVYPHCPHGSLGDWIISRFSSDDPVTPEEAARVLIGVLEAVESLLASGSNISVMRADEIFIDAQEFPQVRLRHDMAMLDEVPQPATGSACKWLAPEETDVSARENRTPWSAVAFRLGLLIYCLGAQVPDPYSQKHPELVLLDLRREATKIGKPVRPDLSTWPHLCWNGLDCDILRNLMQVCLSPEACERPDREGMLRALHLQIAEPL